MRSAYISDLSIESLYPLEKLMESGALAGEDVLLVVAAQLSTSISELLFFDKMDWIKTNATPEFQLTLKVLQLNFMKQNAFLQLELVHTDSIQSINLFLKAMQCSKIIIPDLSVYNWTNSHVLKLESYLASQLNEVENREMENVKNLIMVPF